MLLWVIGFVVVFVLLVIWYISWVFWVMCGEVDVCVIEYDDYVY